MIVAEEDRWPLKQHQSGRGGYHSTGTEINSETSEATPEITTPEVNIRKPH